MRGVIRTFILILGCFALASCGKVQNALVVTNNSGVTAEKVIVTVSGRNYVFASLKHGDSKTQAFAVDGDSGFIVAVSLSDGVVLTNGFGYVTGGGGAYGNRAEIEISKDRQIIGKQK